jgi:hypothetical protein
MTDTYLSNHGMAVQLIARQEGLIERLRGELREAADEIERLRAERDALLPWGRGMTDIIERLRMQDIADCDEAADEIERLRALLQELIDIEGPQPGTADWAEKVRAALTAGKPDAP